MQSIHNTYLSKSQKASTFLLWVSQSMLPCLEERLDWILARLEGVSSSASEGDASLLNLGTFSKAKFTGNLSIPFLSKGILHSKHYGYVF